MTDATSLAAPSPSRTPIGAWILGGALLTLSLAYVVLAAQDRFALQRAQTECASWVGQVVPSTTIDPLAAPQVSVVAVHPAPIDLLMGPQLCTLKFDAIGRVQQASIVWGR